MAKRSIYNAMYYEVATNKVFGMPQIRARHPNISFPHNASPDLSHLGYGQLTRPEPPPADPGYEVVDNGHVGGVIQYKQVPLQPEVVAKEQAAEEERNIALEAGGDPLVRNFVGMNHAQVANYIDTNVVDLNSAKTMLKLMAKMMLTMARRQYGDPQ